MERLPRLTTSSRSPVPVAGHLARRGPPGSRRHRGRPAAWPRKGQDPDRPAPPHVGRRAAPESRTSAHRNGGVPGASPCARTDRAWPVPPPGQPRAARSATPAQPASTRAPPRGRSPRATTGVAAGAVPVAVVAFLAGAFAALRAVFFAAFFAVLLAAGLHRRTTVRRGVGSEHIRGETSPLTHLQAFLPRPLAHVRALRRGGLHRPFVAHLATMTPPVCAISPVASSGYERRQFLRDGFVGCPARWREDAPSRVRHLAADGRRGRIRDRFCAARRISARGHRHDVPERGGGRERRCGPAASPGSRCSSRPSCSRMRSGRSRLPWSRASRSWDSTRLDLWLVHWPPADEALVPVWRAMCSAQEQGLATDIGVSNYSLDQLDRVAGCDRRDAGRQPDPVEPAAVRRRRCSRGTARAASSSRATARCAVALSSNPQVVEVAQQTGRTAAQVIIRWHLQHGIVVIPKSASPERITANADLDFELVPDQMAALDALGS